MQLENPPNKQPFENIVKTLLEINQGFPKNHLARFSDIRKEEQIFLDDSWNAIPKANKLNLLSSLIELNKSDTIFNFDYIAILGLQDTDSEIVIKAIRLCEEYQDKHIAKKLLALLHRFKDHGVVENAIGALGVYIYLGELDKIPNDLYGKIQDSLLQVTQNSENQFLRQKALESLGYSSLEKVQELILNAYRTDDIAWIRSAIIAMKNSADKQWEEIILKHIPDPNYEIQLESVKAVGEIGINEASEVLIELLEDSENMDFETYKAVLWSLSQIGGKNVREIFQYLLENADTEDEIDTIEYAIENLDFFDGLPDLSMFDFSDNQIDLQNDA